jgi:hypothetical protein
MRMGRQGLDWRVQLIELVRGLVCLDLVRRVHGPPAFIDEVDRLTYRSFPATPRVVHVLLLMRGDEVDLRRPHTLAARLAGPDGVRKFPEARARFVGEGEAEGDEVYLMASLSFVEPTFARPGDYEFRIDLDGGELGCLPLPVERLAAAA